MQAVNATVVTWTADNHVSAELLESMRELNYRFLDLVASRSGLGLGVAHYASAAVHAQIAPLSASQKAAAANCPYALFDLRLHDAGYWCARMRAAGGWSVAEESPVDSDTLEFVRVALFFAWHVASTTRLAAQLLLGMHKSTVGAFRSTTIDCLPWLALGEASHLTARWNNCATYWSALTEAASQPNAGHLRRIQLYGLQLAAAARLGS